MFKFGLIDGIIKEPLGGAHSEPAEMAKILKKHIKKSIAELQQLTPEELVHNRINKYAAMGVYDKKNEKKIKEKAVK